MVLETEMLRLYKLSEMTLDKGGFWVYIAKMEYFLIVARGVLCVMVLATVASCSRANNIRKDGSTEASILTSQVDTLTTESFVSKVVASSISELSHFSEIVIVGRFISKKNIINTARNTSDLSEPDPRVFSINQVYQVEVEQYIKGDGPKNIDVTQHLGMIPIDSDENVKGATPSSSTIESVIQKNIHKEFEPVSINTPYLMFLRILDQSVYKLDGYTSNQIYTGVFQPWRFQITDDNHVIPETVVDDIEYLFPEMPFDVAVEPILKPYDPFEIKDTAPYPPPSPYPAP